MPIYNMPVDHAAELRLLGGELDRVKCGAVITADDDLDDFFVQIDSLESRQKIGISNAGDFNCQTALIQIGSEGHYRCVYVSHEQLAELRDAINRYLVLAASLEKK